MAGLPGGPGVPLTVAPCVPMDDAAKVEAAIRLGEPVSYTFSASPARWTFSVGGIAFLVVREANERQRPPGAPFGSLVATSLVGPGAEARLVDMPWAAVRAFADALLGEKDAPLAKPILEGVSP